MLSIADMTVFTRQSLTTVNSLAFPSHGFLLHEWIDEELCKPVKSLPQVFLLNFKVKGGVFHICVCIVMATMFLWTI